MKKNQSLNLTQLRRISMLLAYLRRIPYRSKGEILDYFKENDTAFNERTFYSGKNGQIDHPIPVQIDHLFRLKLTTQFRSKLTT